MPQHTKCFLVSSLLALSLTTAMPAASDASFFDREVPQNKEQITLSFAPLVKKTAPAVVNIYTKKKVIVRSFSPFLNDPFFQHFFGKNFSFGGARERVENSLGSGVIVREDGLIITNYHVIKESDEIKVVLANGEEYDAEVIAKEKKTDLVLLKIDTDGKELPFVELARSDALEVGDLVLAIGNPFGVGQTVTSGIVSAIARTAAGISDYEFFIQTDAAINPGNSGGALVNMQGKLVGVNTAIYSRSGGSNGIGFAIPAEMVTSIIESEATGGKVQRPWMGIAMQEITHDMAEAIDYKHKDGAIVSFIYPGSPSDKAGIKKGDIIRRIDNYKVKDSHALRFRIATYPVGQKAEMVVWRDGKEHTLILTTDVPPEIPARDARLLTGNHPLEGAVAANLSPALANELDVDLLQKGVILMDIKPQTTALRLGFQKGDMIESVNDTTIRNAKQLEGIIKDPETSYWNIVFNREGKKRSLRINR